MMTDVVQWVEKESAGEIRELRAKLSQCQFVHLKSRMTFLGSNLGRSCRKLTSNRLSFGTALNHVVS
jgi:hypothetical protein